MLTSQILEKQLTGCIAVKLGCFLSAIHVNEFFKDTEPTWYQAVVLGPHGYSHTAGGSTRAGALASLLVNILASAPAVCPTAYDDVTLNAMVSA